MYGGEKQKQKRQRMFVLWLVVTHAAGAFFRFVFRLFLYFITFFILLFLKFPLQFVTGLLWSVTFQDLIHLFIGYYQINKRKKKVLVCVRAPPHMF